MNPDDGQRRVVITGMGVIAANGRDLDAFWSSIRDGISAADKVARFDVSKLPTQIAAEIRDFDANRYMDLKTARRLDRSLQYAVAAARLAVEHLNIDFADVDPDRIGVVEGTTLSNNETAFRTEEAYAKKGYRGISPLALINGYCGGGSGEIANELGIKGHAITCCSGSASGNDAVGYAFNMIRNDEVDVMIAGGAEAPLLPSVMGGFSLNKLMTRQNDTPHEAMKPFDRNRDGFLLGEGAGFLVLEELTHALARGATIYAEILAHGRSCEAYHPVAPHPEGIGVYRAMQKALRQARLDINEVDYINAHGTATETNDIVETRAVKRFFGDRSHHVAISSTKPITGHLMAAAGAVETIVCALAVHHQEIPLTLNFAEPDDECDLDYVARHSRPYPVRVAMNLNCGFGGKNSCLILARYNGSNNHHG